MGRYTFRIDNKDPVYKKLIKVPTAYYRLQSNSNGYTIHSHLGMAELGGMHDVKLKQEGDKIVLYKGDLPLKLNGKNFVIKQEDIIGENKDDIIKELISGEEVLISLEYIESSPNFGVGLSAYRYGKGRLKGALKFIDFYDGSDQVLQKIKEKEEGLYFTIEGGNIYISDKDGNCLPVCPDDECYQYQYTQNTCDVLTIDEIISLIKASDAQKDIIDNLKKTTDAQAGIIGELTKTKDAQKSTIDNLKKANNAQQNFALQKGEKLLDDVYEANIVLNDKTIATLPKIGYYMLNDQLVMRNHVTKEEVVIPRDFHYLKVVKFGDNDYKLTFCNVLGNEFFEYKRYDPQYSNVSDEYKFISLSCARKNYNPSFGELLNHRPSFFIKKGPAEPGSDKYAAAVFELTHNGKGKKMATLIDEFGYFDQNGMFKHCSYHEETKCRSYTSAEIDKEYQVTDADSEFYLTEHDNVIIHTIPEL